MAVATKAPSFMRTLCKWAYNMSGFNKYGLYRDDVLYESEEVLEALKRIPEKVIDERNFRLVRAAQCSMQKIVLPETEWTTYEQDINNRYLMPIVEQIKKENEEKARWESTY